MEDLPNGAYGIDLYVGSWQIICTGSLWYDSKQSENKLFYYFILFLFIILKAWQRDL